MTGFTRRVHQLRSVVAVVSWVLLAGSGAAVAGTHQADLDGSQEVPPVSTPATGTAKITLDPVANTVRVVLTLENLTSTQIGAHIHGPAPAGVNAGVLVGLPLGNFDQTFPITQDVEDHIIAGLTYINIHTQNFPGGEIRGQILEQPLSIESTSWSRVKGLYR